MPTIRTSFRQHLILGLAFLALTSLIACSKPAAPPAANEQAQPKPQAASAAPVSSPDEPPAPASDVALPVGFGRHTGDLDEMVKSRNIRALVLINPVGFFYDRGLPRGVNYEALEEFQKFANQKLKTGKLPVKVTFLPMRADQVEAAIT